GPPPGGRGPSERRECEFRRWTPCYPRQARRAHLAFPLFYIHVVGGFAIDLTACWRPERVGMLTVAVELSRALVEHASGDKFVLVCSRERRESLQDLDCEAVLSPYRYGLVMKSRWLPAVEPQLEADAILYPYWPSPPFRRAGAPPAAVF